MNKKIKVGITQGDYNGVGLEVALKALADETMLELMTPVLFADMRLVNKVIDKMHLSMPPVKVIKKAGEATDGQINVADLMLADITLNEGTPTPVSGAGAVAALEQATDAIAKAEIDVLVTAPISKEAAQSDNFKFSGHTEYLGAKAGADYKPQMILFDDRLRVALVSTHLPVSEIPQAVTKEGIIDSLRGFSTTLRRDFNIVRPKIAVLSLNPHCGDGGLLGNEEKEQIEPAIDECMNEGILAFGPFPADGFFGSGSYRNFDGVLAMYHDQGLAPFKTLSGTDGVNFTAGLPFVRTSPDHGTAGDIAWKDKADPTSMREAIYKAIDIYRNRMNFMKASANPLRKQNTERKSDRNDPKAEKKDTESSKESPSNNDSLSNNADSSSKNTDAS